MNLVEIMLKVPTIILSAVTTYMSHQNQNNFTRGSQIFAHQMRMLGQGSINALTIGLIFTVVWLMWRTYQKLSLVSLYYLY